MPGRSRWPKTKHSMGSAIAGWIGAVSIGVFVLLPAASVQAVDCMSLLGLFQQGGSDEEIAAYTNLPLAVVRSCREELSRPLPAGPAGVPPMNAVGAPPAGAAGKPPFGAVGPPPAGAAGKPPLGAAGPPPHGAAGPPPVGGSLQRLP